MRVFIAVRFSEEVKHNLTEIMAELRRQGIRGTYTRPENLHITLAFLGETSQIREIYAAVREVELSPFEISLGKLGHFRDILWLGINGEKTMWELSQRLRASLSRHGVPFDQKPFKAHITLVRRANAEVLPELPVSAEKMTVSRVSVMKSERIDGKLTYTEIQERS